MKILERLQVKHAFEGVGQIEKATFSSIPFIVAGLISALVCSAYLTLFKKAEGLAVQTYQHHMWWFFGVTPFVFIFSTWVVRKFAPGNGSSGLPQIMATLKAENNTETFAKRFLNWRVLPVKIISCVAGSLGGGGIGPEGPCVQLAAIVFNLTRDFWKKIFGIELSFYNMIVAGGAGGIAAAFNAPLAGIIFAVEELAKSHLVNFRLGTIEAVLACGFLVELLDGPYLYLGYPTLPSINGHDVLLVLCVSAVTGIAGALFGVALRKIIFWRRKLTAKGVYISAALAGLATAGLILVVGESALGSGHELMKEILFRHSMHPTILSSAITSLARFITPLFVACTEVAAGIFAPSLAAGASIGQFVGHAFNPALGNLAPICGMVGFLTGLTRTPLTAFVIMMEMTDRHSSIFAMMLAAAVAFISARAVEPNSFYETMAESYFKA